MTGLRSKYEELRHGVLYTSNCYIGVHGLGKGYRNGVSKFTNICDLVFMGYLRSMEIIR